MLRLRSCLVWLVAWIVGSALLSFVITRLAVILGHHLSVFAAVLLGSCLTLAMIGLLIRPEDQALPHG